MKGAHLFIFMCMCVYLSLCVRHMSMAVAEAKRWRGIPGARAQVVGSYRTWVLAMTFGSFGRAARISNHSHLTIASEKTGLDGSLSQFIPFVSLIGFRIAMET